jgi:hypothetical protein
MRILSLFVLVLFTPILLAAENLIFNSSFEVGTAGFICAKYLRPDVNPQMIYEGLSIDTNEFVSGKQSLRLPNRFAETVECSSEEFILKTNTVYTISLWVKCTVAGYPFRVSVVYAPNFGIWKVFGATTIVLGKKWTRYSYSFNSGNFDPGSAYGHLRMLCGRSDTPVDIWFDDLQLDEGALQQFKAGTTIEAALENEQLLFIDTIGSEKTMTTHLVNYSDSTVKGRLTIKGESKIGRGGNVSSAPIDFALSPRGHKTIISKMPYKAFGYYRLTPQIEAQCSWHMLPEVVTVAGKVERKAIDIDRTACVSFNHDLFSPLVPPWTAPSFPGHPFSPGIRMMSSMNKDLEMLAKMGCRLLRLWSPGEFRWSVQEPKENEYSWHPLKQILSMKETYGFEILPSLGNMDFIDLKEKNPYVLGALPEWLKDKSQIQEKFPLKAKYKNGVVYLPPIERWRRYIGEIAKIAKGKITHYEIMNEPNLIFTSAKDYILYLKAAYDALKAVDPKCRVLSPCVTGDLRGNINGFSGEFIHNNGLDYSDIFSFHPYNSPELNSPAPADRQIADLRTQFQAAGKKDCPLWNTELFYLSQINPGKILFTPNHPAQRFLTDLGEGVGQSICLPSFAVFESPLLEHQSHSLKSLPTPNVYYIVYNTLARHFEGAKPLAKFKWPGENVCYIYELDGKPLAAFWTYGPIPGMNLTLKGSTSKLQLFDICGNALPFPGDGVIKLGAEPLYIETKDISVNKDDLIGMLKNAKVEAEKPHTPD